MGNTTTAATQILTQEQKDIKHLGSIFPFGDAELYKLYRVYQKLQHQQQRQHSFLTELGILCLGEQAPNTENIPHTPGEKDPILERATILQIIQDKILPMGFSDRIYEICFSLPTALEPSWQAESDEQRLERMEEYRIKKLDKFFEGIANMGRKGSRAAVGVLFDYVVVSRDGRTLNQPEHVLSLAYRISLASSFLQAAKEGTDISQWIPSEKDGSCAFRALGDSVKQHVSNIRQRYFPSSSNGTDAIEKQDFQEWTETIAPLLSPILGTFMWDIFFPEIPFPSSRTKFDFPKISAGSVFFDSPTSPLLFSFACLSSSLGGSWHRLYTSASDGLSFNRLQNALLGYGGPTLIVIQSATGAIFGAFAGAAWKESRDFYGNSDCFLYQLVPTTAVYRPTGNGQNFMYCNSEARSRGYDGFAHGIGFGGSREQPRLFIAESFDGCFAGTNDLTYEGGPLLPKLEDGSLQKKFDIESLEVWGVGGEAVVAEALDARNKQRAITEANIRKARKVDKAAFLDDFRSGLIESKAFAHREQMRGRADAAIDDKHKNAYVYEK